MDGSAAAPGLGAQSLIESGSKALNDNRLDEAIAHLVQAAGAEPQNGQVWLMLGIAYLRSDMLNEAVKALCSAAHLRPSNAPTRYFLGLAYQRAGNAAVAAEQFQFALQIDPNYHEARQALGTMGPGLMHTAHPPMAAAHGDQRYAMAMEQMQARRQQQKSSNAKLRRMLFAFGASMIMVIIMAAVSVPLLLRSSRGSPSQVVRRYLEATYVQGDNAAARALTVEGSMDAESFDELSSVFTEETLAISQLNSYVVGEPVMQGNRAEVPVDLDYVDPYGEVHRETATFVAVGFGPMWKVSLMQSIAGGGGAGYGDPSEYEEPDFSIPLSGG